MKRILALGAALAVLAVGLLTTLPSSSSATNFSYHWPRDVYKGCGPGCTGQHDWAIQTVYLKPILNKAADPSNTWAAAIEQAYTDWHDTLVNAGFSKMEFVFNTTDGCPSANGTETHWICVGFYTDPAANYYAATNPVLKACPDCDHLKGYTLTIATGKIDHDLGDAYGGSYAPTFVTKISRHEAGHTIALAHDSVCGTMNPTLQLSDSCRLVFESSEVSDVISNHNHAP